MADRAEKSEGLDDDWGRKRRRREQAAGETAGGSYRASGLVQRRYQPRPEAVGCMPKLWASLARPHAGPGSKPRYLSSFFSSLRKRQSAPWAMTFWGLDLIIPAS